MLQKGSLRDLCGCIKGQDLDWGGGRYTKYMKKLNKMKHTYIHRTTRTNTRRTQVRIEKCIRVNLNTPSDVRP
jgi:hypothetical protein